MGLLGPRKITIMINGVKNTFTVEEIKEMILDRSEWRSAAHQWEAKHDELKWRLASANRKLKEYGHPGEL